MLILATAFAAAGVWWWTANSKVPRRRLSSMSPVRDAARSAAPRRRPRRKRANTRSGSHELPQALDLLAACLAAGAMLAAALIAVADSFEGPIGITLREIADLTAQGGPPEDAWASALANPRWSSVARSVVRAHHSGATLTDVLNRAAAELRRDLRTEIDAAAARASVRVVLPLGLCFLPAFLLVGVVPVAAGFAGSLW